MTEKKACAAPPWRAASACAVGVSENKESIQELFNDNTLAEEVDKIKTALVKHGIMTP